MIGFGSRLAAGWSIVWRSVAAETFAPGSVAVVGAAVAIAIGLLESTFGAVVVASRRWLQLIVVAWSRRHRLSGASFAFAAVLVRVHQVLSCSDRIPLIGASCDAAPAHCPLPSEPPTVVCGDELWMLLKVVVADAAALPADDADDGQG